MNTAVHGAESPGPGQGFDPAYTQRCYEENLRFLAEDYFRAEFVHAERFPLEEVGRRPIILLPNHSGMTLSWDNIMLDFLVYDLLKRSLGSAEAAIQQKVVRMVDPLLVERSVLNPFGIDRWWTRIGCRSASYANFERAVADKRIVCLSPEGVAGIAKGFHRRYQLERFSSSFLSLARRYGAIVIPVSVVNAEYLRPYNYSWAWVNRFFRKLGVPFLPLGLSAGQIVFPATFLTPWPAKLTYVLEEPMVFQPAGEPLSREDARRETGRLQARQQALLDDAVRRFHAPFAMKSLWQRMRQSPRRKMFLPFFWHEMFLKTDAAPSWMHWLYKLPLSYPAIWLAKRLSSAGKPHSVAGDAVGQRGS